MTELPKGWETKTFGDLFCRLQYGLTAKAAHDLPGLRFLRITDIKDAGFIDWNFVPTCIGADADVSRYKLADGDFVFARSGSIEKAARIRCPPPAVFASYLIRGVPVDRERADWLAWFIRCPLYLEQIRAAAAGIGLSNVNATKLSAVVVPIPPLLEQRRIVTKLDSLLSRSKSAREELTRIPHLVERYKRGILAAAFRGELTANWRQHHPHSANGKQLLAELIASREKHSTKKGGRAVEALDQPVDLEALPHGWTWCPVAILASVVSDGVHKKPDYVEQGVPFLTVRNLTAGPGITFDGCRFVTQSDHEEFIKRTHPERGDLLISKDGTLGVVRAIRTDVVFSIFVSVALVKPADRSMTDYLELAFTSPQVQQQMVGVGTGLQHIHLTDLRRDFIPIAPAEERAEIVKRVHSAFAYIERLETETSRAAKLIDRLDQATLANAFRGDLLPQECAEQEHREQVAVQ